MRTTYRWNKFPNAIRSQNNPEVKIRNKGMEAKSKKVYFFLKKGIFLRFRMCDSADFRPFKIHGVILVADCIHFEVHTRFNIRNKAKTANTFSTNWRSSSHLKALPLGGHSVFSLIYLNFENTINQLIKCAFNVHK